MVYFVPFNSNAPTTMANIKNDISCYCCRLSVSLFPPFFLFHRSNLISSVNTENYYSIVIAIATKMKSMNSRMLIEQNYMYSKWNTLVMNFKCSPVIATANLSNEQKMQMIVIERCRFTRCFPFCEMYDNKLN